MIGRTSPLRPLLCTRYHAEVLADDAVAFVGENGSAVVRDPVALQVVPLIDGRRTAEEIERTLSPAVAAAEVREALAEMAQAGLVVESADVPAPISALWAELGVSEFRLREVLVRAVMGVRQHNRGLDPAGFRVGQGRLK